MRRLFVKNKQLGVMEILYSDADHDLVSRYTWFITNLKKYKHIHYTMTHICVNGKRTTTSMHRLIMGGDATNKHIDHINRNGLDNRRENLRFVTPQVNRLNSKVNANSRTGFKNITQDKKSGMFLVKIFSNANDTGRGKFYGSYALLSDAIRARDLARKLHFPEELIFCKPCLQLNVGFNRINSI